MRQSLTARLTALALCVALPAGLAPAWTAPATAQLVGRIVSADGKTPVAGAVVHLRAPAGESVSAGPTGQDGIFKVAEAAPGSYEAIVETDAGLYRVADKLQLQAGENRPVEMVLRPGELKPADIASLAPAAGLSGRSKAWIGVAFVVATAALVVAIDDDEEAAASPSQPSE